MLLSTARSLAPQAVGQRATRDDAAGVAHEALEQVVFRARERDEDAAARDAARRRIEPQIRDLQLRVVRRRAAAAERAQPRDEHRERKRLGEVVVGAGVEGPDDVRRGVAGGEHQHRRAIRARAKALHDLHPVEARQHHVEDGDVEVGGGRELHGLRPGRRDLHDVPVLGEAAPHQGAHARVVFDEQEPHDGIVPDPVAGPAPLQMIFMAP